MGKIAHGQIGMDNKSILIVTLRAVPNFTSYQSSRGTPNLWTFSVHGTRNFAPVVQRRMQCPSCSKIITCFGPTFK